MSRMPWFRMYSEARMDKKLACLKDDEFRVWFNLLCMASEQDERGTIAYDDADLLAIEVAGGNPDLLGHTMSRLVTLHICDVTPGGVTFVNFEKRQTRKPSDTPERTRERKARSRLNTPMSHDVTPRHAQSRSVTRIEERREEESRGEKSNTAKAAKKPEYSADFEAFWARSHREGSKRDAFTALSNLDPESRQAAIDAIDTWTAYFSRDDVMAQHVVTWINKRMWESAIPKSRTNGHRPDQAAQIRQWAEELKQEAGLR